MNSCLCGYGLDSTYAVEGMPHVTKIIRKPRGVGVEMKALCDGETNIMLRLEIMEGVERQHAKQYHAQYGSGTSITLRLCQPWQGSGRTVIGDSAFASVKTLQALQCELGLFFMGMVKTASRCYSKAFFKKWYEDGWDPHPRRPIGSWITLKVILYCMYELSNYLIKQSYYSLTNNGAKDQPMYAVGWHDAKCKTIISNCGVTIKGNDSTRERHEIVSVAGLATTQIIKKVVMQPQMIENFFEYFSCIDIHDHLRQGSLRLEESWKTKTWWHRIFSTILGIIVTDCFYAHKYTNTHREVLTYTEFVDTLAYQLIFNDYFQRTRQRNHANDESNVDGENNVYAHQLGNLIDLPMYERIRGDPHKRARRRCKVCGEKTSFYCMQCSNTHDPNNPELVCLCPATTTCFVTYSHSNVLKNVVKLLP
jgi:hypothetical protein